MSTLCVLGSSVLTTLIIMSLSNMFFLQKMGNSWPSLSPSAICGCRLAIPSKVVVPAPEPAKPAAKPYPAACSAHANCADQQGDCCPTNAGILMGCCLSGLDWIGSESWRDMKGHERAKESSDSKLGKIMGQTHWFFLVLTWKFEYAESNFDPLQ